MHRLRARFSVVVVVALFSPFVAEGGTVLLMEPRTGSEEKAVHQEFFNELGLVLEQDKLFRQVDEADTFFKASVDEKIATAGLFCDSSVSMSVVWIDTADGAVLRLGVVVDTPSGKVARVMTFDAPMRLSEVALVAGELLQHGRKYAETSTAQEDGWIVVPKDIGRAKAEDSANNPEALTLKTPMMDTERPWDSPDSFVNIALEFPPSRLSVGVGFEFLQAISTHTGPGLWMGQTIHGTLRVFDRWYLSLVVTALGGVIPDDSSLEVRGIQLIPRLRAGFMFEFNSFDLLLAISGGASRIKLWMTGDEIKDSEDQFWEAVGYGEVQILYPPEGPIAIYVGSVLSFMRQKTVYRLAADEPSETREVRELFSIPMVSWGAKLGFTLFL
jgi:hypothetical protein